MQFLDWLFRMLHWTSIEIKNIWKSKKILNFFCKTILYVTTNRRKISNWRRIFKIFHLRHTGDYALLFCRKALIFDETIEQWIRSGSRTVLLERALALALETYPCCMSVFGLLQGLLDRSSFGGKFPLSRSHRKWENSIFYKGIFFDRWHFVKKSSDIFRDASGTVSRKRERLESYASTIQ